MGKKEKTKGKETLANMHRFHPSERKKGMKGRLGISARKAKKRGGKRKQRPSKKKKQQVMGAMGQINLRQRRKGKARSKTRL